MNPDFQSRAARIADGLALACLAAMVSLPFLYPHHRYPIPSFWAEWWAFAFGLAAAGLLLIRPGAWRPFGMPAVTFIPFAFLATALVQYSTGRWNFVESWLMYAAYLIWACLLMLAGRSFVARRGLEPLTAVVAVAILLGALANTAAAAWQFHHPGYQSDWVFARLGTVMYGNLGQPNHFNHQLWLGIASLCYLHARQRCRLAVVLPALLLLLVAATMTSSKSILLYAVTLTALAGFMCWRHPVNAEGRRLWSLALPLLPLVLLLQWLVSIWGIAGDTSMQIATQRLFNEVAGFQIRWRLALAAWDVFLQTPLLGIGIGALPWQFFIANSRFPIGEGPSVAEHTHNMPLQLLAEFGIAPVSIMLIVLLRWAIAMSRQPWRIEQWWLVGLLAVGAIHSQLEYPLWYSFFLGIAALLLGASDRPAIHIDNGRRGAVMCALVIGVGIAPLLLIRSDYSALEQTINRPLSSPSASAEWKAKMETLMDIQRDSLLAPHVMVSLSVMMKLDDEALEAKVDVCSEAMKFAPSRRIVFKCGALMALAGEEKAALEQMTLALNAYPKEAARVAADLGMQARTYPRLEPLRRLAERHAERAQSLP
jgi:hypothetical protein